jgi:uncharacterized protein (DUF433 family)
VDKHVDIYGGVALSELPLYSVTDAARVLKVAVSTLRSWVAGKSYPVSHGEKFAQPVIHLGPQSGGLLSFSNLVEAHLLATIRRRYGVALQQVRPALDYVERTLNVTRPLLSQQFKTDGKSLFVERVGKLINASREGQLAMADLLSAALQRVESDPDGVPMALYPWRLMSEDRAAAQRPIVMDPRHRFGLPILSGSKVPIDVIIDRWRAGEPLATIADDFEVDVAAVEDAVRWWTDEAQEPQAAAKQ